MMTCIRDGWRVAGGKKVKKVGKSRRCVRYLLVVMHTAYRSTSYCLRRCGASSKMIKYLRARTLCR